MSENCTNTVPCVADDLRRGQGALRGTAVHIYRCGDTRPLRLEKARQYIELVVNVEDLRKDTGSVATNPIIQAYVKEKYGFYVHSLYIAQVRDKLGIKLHESANKVAQPKRKVSICPDYKEAAILEAFHHYGIYRA